MTFQKHIHFNPDIEQAVIGACLIEQQAFGRIYHFIEPENFYYKLHQDIFSTMKDMYINGIPIDTFTVTDQITRIQGKPEIFGKPTPYCVSAMTNYVVSGANIEYHSYIIKSMWVDRELIRLTSSGKSEGDSNKERINNLQEKLYNLQQRTTEHDWSDMTKLMVELYQHQSDIKLTGGVGLTTSIPQLDKQNGGFHPGQMIVIGARPSVGKSAFAGALAMAISEQKKVVGIISLEMSNAEIAARLAALDTQTDFRVLFRGLYADEQQTQEVYKRISNHTSQLPIYVSDKTNVDITEIRSKADKLKSLHGLDCLIIDYLQLVDVPESNNRTRENEISKVSRYCKIMAKELNIPVVLLCQLNRESAHRTKENRYPRLSDIRESGSIEQDADIVLFLHRDWLIGELQNEDGTSTEYQADLIVSKWRNGAANTRIKLDFNPGQMKFSPIKSLSQIPYNVDYQGDNPF